MAFWFRRSEPTRAPATPAPLVVPQHLHRFRGYTEAHFISGLVRSADRLSDALNRREPVVVEDAVVVGLDAPLSTAERRDRLLVDPFELDLVLGGPLPERSAAERAARRIFKVRYPVKIEGPNFEVRGTIHLFPGTAPEFEGYHTGSLFLPVTEAVARRAGRLVTDPAVDVVLVNRHSIRRIRQLDERPGH
ncbi:MAG TPA: hypothetical protein VNO86_12290 [Candidatus Binatia bacterium]|nr:hypothetical protein [Candidatus Binatia bacterium]